MIERSPDNARKESVRLYDALGGLGIPSDVIVMVGGIAYPANRYGRVISEAA